MKPNVDLSNPDDYKKIKNSQMEEDLGLIYGRFTHKIFYDGEQLLDMLTARPYKMVDYEPCLESDSRFRKDL